MNNLTYRTYNIESIKDEFLNIGFSKEAIDFVFLHNDNYNFEFLKEKIIDVEKNLRRDIFSLDIKIDSIKNEFNTKIDFVEKNLNTKIDSVNTKIDNVEKSLNTKIDSLDIKIDSVKNELNSKIGSLDTKIDAVEKSLNEKLSTGNRLIHFMIIAAAILGPFLNALFTKYLQFIK
ncbi:Bdr family repetitive protein [Borreliella burgdorferi]|uniref:Bdr family repetitive protein n=1 Tax=Borreliella burgdorferi TaxID=139 RepID=UPI001E32ACFF|nr:Bdr family repetitive protein [Borreliella burgdorferi]MCD2374460.1 Bdr family repetitive protein [Borreliella burgdorferi]MCD2375584.1 Bdr family repetitive protein [Borreliella burgdorferi]MCD2410032.1 Bdr family repetitive protein [Borreliella burgdorferi]MCD2415966.1 Bdr family repetitive protein [Borreliella burgdorferi]MCD2417226.1 Bdr family repetitive protein [Borreliella burgdorferi]